MSWFSTIGDKLVRTDIWVLFISLLFIVSTTFHILCGIDLVKCHDSFVENNRKLLTFILIAMTADLGIKRVFK